MWSDKLKTADVNIHLIATGAGAGLQQELWAVPGSSAYLSGASFPYSAAEQSELLGFMPEHFCSEEAAIDLASAAYMKAYRFGGKKPVGVGLTASVASEKEHRGDHRAYACIITDEMVRVGQLILEKGTGKARRELDGEECDGLGFFLLTNSLGVSEITTSSYSEYYHCHDATQLATDRFWARSMFLPDGKRLDPNTFKFDGNLYALMPGAFNPPHQGHFGLADQVRLQWGAEVIFEICATHPIKPALTVQQMLQRAKLLQGRPTLFTRDALYIDKARAHPNLPIVVGADAMVRMLDHKWGDPEALMKEFIDLGTEFYIGNRMVDGKLITREDVEHLLPASIRDENMYDILYMFRTIQGQWDISSTEIRAKRNEREGRDG